MPSYIINKSITSVDMFFNTEHIDQFSIGPAQPNIQINNEQCAELSIFNRIGSGKKVTIDYIDILPTSANDLADSANAGTYNLNTITSQSGGIDIPMIKLNSSKSTPTGISVRYKSTDTVNKLLRRCVSAARYQGIGSQYGFINTMNGSLYLGSTNILNGSDNTAIQKLIIRENEGVQLIGTNNYRNDIVKIDVLIRDTTNGGFETILYTIDTTIDKSASMISIFNTSGSGQIFYIESINVYIQNRVSFQGNLNASTIPNYMMFPIQMHNKGFNYTDIIKMDSNNAAVPSTIEIKEKSTISYAKDNGKITKPFIKFFGCGMYAAGAGAAFYTSNTVSRPNKKQYNLDFELYEDDGIGIQLMLPSQENKYDLIIHFTVEDYTAPSSGGETGFAYA